METNQIKLLYYNKQVNYYDGSNIHAVGLLNAFRANDSVDVSVCEFNKSTINYGSKQNRLKILLGKRTFTIVRVIRKWIHTKHNYKYAVSRLPLDYKPDVIIARSDIYDKMPMLLANHYQCKLVFEINAPFIYEKCIAKKADTKWLVNKYEVSTYSYADGFYMVSEKLREMMFTYYPEQFKGKPILCQPNGYSADIFCEDMVLREQIRNDVRSEMGVEDKFVLVFVGSLQVWHGIEQLLKMAETLEPNEKVEFWIFGDGECASLIQDYKDTHKNVHWFGNVKQNELKRFLYGSDLGIMPYPNMPNFYFSPLKMFEFIGAGLPFLTQAQGQIEDICSQCFSPNFIVNENGYVDRINAIFKNRQLLDAMRREVQEERKNHTWNKVSDSLVSWLSSEVL